MSWDKLAENKIREAMANGEFDQLPSGKRVDLEEYFATPEDVRMAHSILKNANCLPEEVSLMNEVARLQRLLQATCDARVRSETAAALHDQQLRLDIVRDQRKRNAGRKT